MDFFNCEELLWLPIVPGTKLNIIDNHYCRILTRIEWRKHMHGEKLSKIKLSEIYSIAFLHKNYDFSEIETATTETVDALAGFWPTSDQIDIPEKTILDRYALTTQTNFRKFQLT